MGSRQSFPKARREIFTPGGDWRRLYSLLSKSLKGEPFAVVSVAMDHRTARILPFAKKFGIVYPVLEGRKGSVDSRYFGMGLPQSYVIRADGTLVGRVMGPRPWSSPEFVRYFRAMAEEGRKTAATGGRRNP